MYNTKFESIINEAGSWSLDKLTEYILDNYHVGTLDELADIAQTAHRYVGQNGAKDMNELAGLLSESYEDLSMHFRKEEVMLFPYVMEVQETLNQNLQPQPFHCGTVQAPCRQMMLEHAGEIERYDRVLDICKAFEAPFAETDEAKQLVERISKFVNKLHEHIHIENEVLFPRVIEAEGLPVME